MQANSRSWRRCPVMGHAGQELDTLVCACGAALAIERDQIEALRRRRSKLPQHRRHLPAVIRAVIDDVLEYLPERLRRRNAVECPVLDDAADAVLAEPRENGAHLPFMVGPHRAEA